MKKITIYALLAAVLFIGCKKVGETAPVKKGSVEIVSDVPEGAMLFNVKIDGIGTKSHFADNASTVSGETAPLEWDADDDIGVYAVPFVNGDFDLAHVKCGLANIKTINSDGSAVFYSIEPDKNWWMAEDDEDDESTYLFLAYYPANGKKKEFEVVAKFTDGGQTQTMYSPLFVVPDIQDGKSWASEQILMNFDLSMMFTRGQLLTEGSKVTFASFKPITSLFQFKLLSGDGTDHSGIDKIKLTLKYREKSSTGTNSTGYHDSEGVWHNIEFPAKYYYGYDYSEREGFFGLAGKGLLSVFIGGGFDNLGVMPLNPAVFAGEDDDEYFNQTLSSALSITVNFDDDLVTIPALTANPEQDLQRAETYYVVLAPLIEDLVWSTEYSGGVVLFEAYQGDNVVLVAEKAVPTHGFIPGYRYIFNLAMGQYYEMSGIDAGGYTGIQDLTN